LYQKTLKASSLSNRGCEAPPDSCVSAQSTLRESPICGCWGTLSECILPGYIPPAGRSDLRLLSDDAFSVRGLRYPNMMGKFSY